MSGLNRPKLNLKYAYERVKSALQGLTQTVNNLDPIAKNSAGNGIYNGKMTISQRGDYTSPTAVTNNIYYLDRWKTYLSGVTGTVTDTVGSAKYIATSTASGYIGAQQLVEDVAKYKGETITISCPVTSDTEQARIFVWDGSSVVAGDSHTGSGGEEMLSATVTLSGSATAVNVYLVISTAAGGTVSITSGQYIQFGDARLDLGEHRLSGDREYADELALCRGHLDMVVGDGASTTYNVIGLGNAVNTTVCYIEFPTNLNSAPDFVDYSDLTHFKLRGGATTYAITAIALSFSSRERAVLSITSSGLVAGNSYSLRVENVTTAHLGFGNEL